MIRSIEGLRGVAALMVVFFHAFVLARWGGAPAQWGLVQNAWLFAAKIGRASCRERV